MVGELVDDTRSTPYAPTDTDSRRLLIPDGTTQIWIGAGLNLFGLFPALAATPFNGAGTVAAACFAIGGALLFWGLIRRYFSIVERKLVVLIRLQEEARGSWPTLLEKGSATAPRAIDHGPPATQLVRGRSFFPAGATTTDKVALFFGIGGCLFVVLCLTVFLRS